MLEQPKLTKTRVFILFAHFSIVYWQLFFIEGESKESNLRIKEANVGINTSLNSYSILYFSKVLNGADCCPTYFRIEEERGGGGIMGRKELT